jgi:release factor glutamine methyltransferase
MMMMKNKKLVRKYPMAYEEITTALSKAYKILQQAKIDSYRLDARLLLEHTCNITHEKIIANPNLLVETTIFDQMIERRKNREPISHILGNREFYGYDFKVTANTLDPRADSESLIEAALEYFTNKDQDLKILDLGTGTGCLLLSLLKLYHNASGVGVDISEAALDVARDNAKNLDLDQRVSFVLSNWTEKIEQKFDLIVTNPPYIKDEEILTLEEEVRIYEPNLALSGGEDGLDCYKLIAASVGALLNKNGIIIVESGANQDDDIVAIFKEHNLEKFFIKKDLAGINRAIVFRNTRG